MPDTHKSADGQFANVVFEHCRWALAKNRRCPSDAWPVRERLAVAVVLMSKTYLDQNGYTVASAHRRLFDSMDLSVAEFSMWVESLRRRLAKVEIADDATEELDQCSDCGEFTSDLWTQSPVTTPYWVCRDCHITRYGTAPDA